MRIVAIELARSKFLRVYAGKTTPESEQSWVRYRFAHDSPITMHAGRADMGLLGHPLTRQPMHPRPTNGLSVAHLS